MHLFLTDPCHHYLRKAKICFFLIAFSFVVIMLELSFNIPDSLYWLSRISLPAFFADPSRPIPHDLEWLVLPGFLIPVLVLIVLPTAEISIYLWQKFKAWRASGPERGTHRDRPLPISSPLSYTQCWSGVLSVFRRSPYKGNYWRILEQDQGGTICAQLVYDEWVEAVQKPLPREIYCEAIISPRDAHSEVLLTWQVKSFPHRGKADDIIDKMTAAIELAIGV